MARVYEARHRNGARVAIKVLRVELSQSARARERFLREGHTANRIGHPNAVRVLDDGETRDGCPFLVMDLLEGQTLQALCEANGGRLGASEVSRIACAVLDVLAAAHARGVVHRDIKPSNVFITSDGAIKVLDFGIALVRDELQGDPRVTESGLSLGTPAFMAPEQARGDPSQVDARVDLWAVGATMFFCLSGKHVHDPAKSANEALIFAATQRAPRLSTLRPDVPPHIAAVVDRALALSVTQRWQTADAMSEAIRAVAASALSEPHVRCSGPAYVKRPGDDLTDVNIAPVPRRSLRGWHFLLALFAAGIGAAGAVAFALHEPATASGEADWTCLDRPPALSYSPASVDVQVIAFDVFQPFTLGSAAGGDDFTLLQYTPLVGTSVQVCTAFDPLCANPATPKVLTDTAGAAHFSLPGGFRGLYMIERPGSFTALYYPGRLAFDKPRITYPVNPLQYGALGALGGALSVLANHDPNVGLGHLFVTANDCRDRHAAGVSIELVNVKAPLSFYLQNDLPNPAATQTGSYGTAGFIDVPEGNLSIVARRVQDGRITGKMNVYIRAGATTFVDLRPVVRDP